MQDYAYPLLREVSDSFSGTCLRDVLLLVSFHLLGPQKKMVELMINKSGLHPDDCVISGKSYSTNAKAYHECIEMGCIVAPFSTHFQPDQPFDSWYEAKLMEFFGNELARRNLDNYRMIIVLEDGGFLHPLVEKLVPDHLDKRGTEQTSSGHARIKQSGISFPIRSVARWWHKLVREAPYIAEHAFGRVINHLTKRGKENPRTLIYGLGPIGRQLAARMASAKVGNTFATDPKLMYREPNGKRITDNGAINVFVRQGGTLLPTNESCERIGEFDLIIGASGSSVMCAENISRTHPRVSLISVSSSDHEFPAVTFRQSQAGRIHDDYSLDQRVLVNSGFPITFYGNYYELPPSQIELTIADLQTSVLHHASEGSEFCPPISLIGDRMHMMWSH